ncbi:unnamed protein product [Clavelina lepadiformis]|uniref:Uncharacterized protein n=1 Tax=Clavelina lepadiformis TaxID=159417 RepID=A0ABP0H2S7_CLALP
MASGQPCSSWELFRDNADTGYKSCGFSFGVRSRTSVCPSRNYSIKIDRILIKPNDVNWACDSYSGLEGCTEASCTSSQQTVTIACTFRITGDSHTCTFSYVNKCNAFQWSDWEQVNGCVDSGQTRYERRCRECDGRTVNQSLCFGDDVQEDSCIPSWREWNRDGPCITSNCSSNGKRISTRRCVFDNGTEAPDVSLCSNGTDTIEEVCYSPNVTCLASWSEWIPSGDCQRKNCSIQKGVRTVKRKCIYENGTEESNTSLCSTESSQLQQVCHLNRTLDCTTHHATEATVTDTTYARTTSNRQNSSPKVEINVIIPLVIALLLVLAMSYVAMQKWKSQKRMRLPLINNQFQVNFQPTVSPENRESVMENYGYEVAIQNNQAPVYAEIRSRTRQQHEVAYSVANDNGDVNSYTTMQPTSISGRAEYELARNNEPGHLYTTMDSQLES